MNPLQVFSTTKKEGPGYKCQRVFKSWIGTEHRRRQGLPQVRKKQLSE